jgi:uncharacterized protein (DUF885 family)
MSHHRVTAALVLVFASISLFSACVSVPPESSSRRLDALASEAYERALDLFPEGEAVARGAGPRQDRLEIPFSDEHRARQRAYHQWILARLKEIPLSELNETEQLTHRLLAYRSERALEWLGLPLHRHYVFIQIDGGVATNLIKLVTRQPFRTESDYRAWFRRLNRYPEYLDGVARVMRDGIESGITIPRVLVERALAQLEAIAPPEEKLADSALWKPMTAFPSTIDAATQAALEAEYRRLLIGQMFPAMRRLASFVRDDYLPRARTTDGIASVPGGDAMYRYLVRSETTTDRSPDEIHELGLKEVARISTRLLEAGRKAGFEGPMPELQKWVESNPANYPFATAEDVIAYLYDIHKRVVPHLPRLFGRMPKAPFEIRLHAPELAASLPAQWHPPSDDGTRPGMFMMPVVNARTRSTFGLAALLAHEGMPGHHFDGGIKLENKVPDFRRRMWVNAFGEGWALYAESLGHELGLYDEPLAIMGRYSFELFRACRLVVDTGLHAKGWSREQAIRYLMDECGTARGGATAEVLRYMAWPGQALGYKIGELTILDIRREAEQRLGARFDVRAFHDTFLGEGHMPLSMARERMRAWAEREARKP